MNNEIVKFALSVLKGFWYEDRIASMVFIFIVAGAGWGLLNLITKL